MDAVKAKADAYVIIVPGDFNGKELFKHVLQVFGWKGVKESAGNHFKGCRSRRLENLFPTVKASCKRLNIMLTTNSNERFNLYIREESSVSESKRTFKNYNN